MTKYLLIFITVLTSFLAKGQGEHLDSLDYLVLRQLTESNAWVNKFKRNPTSGLDKETFDFIKDKFPMVDLEYSDIKDYEYEKGTWDKDRIDERKLKSNGIRIPLIGSPPRRKAISYISCPLYLNKEKTIALIRMSQWADIGWNQSSGFGEFVIFIFESNKWRIIRQPISGFVT